MQTEQEESFKKIKNGIEISRAEKNEWRLDE